MTPNTLATEGDINFSENRKQWYKLINAESIDLLEEDSAYFLHQALSTPCLDVIVACEGIYITAQSGKRYMDFHGNSVHQIGYRNQYVIEKVKAQIDILPFSPRRFTNSAAINFAKKLTSYFSENFNRVLFSPGGTSAVGMALKLSRIITKKHKVVSWADSFHGASLDAIAVGGEEQFKKYMGKLSPETINTPQPTLYRNIYEDGNDIPSEILMFKYQVRHIGKR